MVIDMITKIDFDMIKEYQFEQVKVSFTDAIVISTMYEQVFGLGERYNSINQKGNKVLNMVEEKFCNQGEKTYFPLPFFILDNGFGFFVDTKEAIEFEFGEDIRIKCNNIELIKLYVLNGSYREIISDFIHLTGKQKIAPKWIFGPWISAHRWNSQEMVEDVLMKLDEHNIPITVMVLEQWSDEATFYIFNGAKYPDKECLNYDDFDFSISPWKNPKKMIEQLHDVGIRLLLWQCPVVKKIPENEPYNSRHAKEWDMVKEKSLSVLSTEGPYIIPEGHWFNGSMIPDFTNQDTLAWWFGNRRYLMDIGIDGFKTDGGEFIYDCATNFIGETELELKNNYCLEYVKAYNDFLGCDRVAFSRAGYIGQQTHTLVWAGDQKSTFEELRSVYNAGINASFCGQINWGFDIGGFSGELPSVELYFRATQLAVFVPIMQIHSEPVGGQFSVTDPTREFNNERTPWNMTADDEIALSEILALYRLRMNLIPYIYSEYLKALSENSTIMRHMNVDYVGNYPNDQYIFGQIIVAPILEEKCEIKEVVLPLGTYYNIFTNEKIIGTYVSESIRRDSVLAFVKEGNAIVTALPNLKPERIDNKLAYKKLYFRLYGNKGMYRYVDQENDFTIFWNDNEKDIKGTVNVLIETMLIK